MGFFPLISGIMGYVEVMGKRKSRQPITQAEFQELLGRMKLTAVREKGDHGNQFFGNLDGVPVVMYFDFLMLDGYIRRRARKAGKGQGAEPGETAASLRAVMSGQS